MRKQVGVSSCWRCGGSPFVPRARRVTRRVVFSVFLRNVGTVMFSPARPFFGRKKVVTTVSPATSERSASRACHSDAERRHKQGKENKTEINIKRVPFKKKTREKKKRDTIFCSPKTNDTRLRVPFGCCCCCFCGVEARTRCSCGFVSVSVACPACRLAGGPCCSFDAFRFLMSSC